MSELSYYFDRIADEFNGYYTGCRPSLVQEIGYRIFRRPGLEKRFSDTVKIVGGCKDVEILDVGCGPGIYAQYFSKNGAKVTAIDISQNMIKLARENLLRSGIENCKFILGDFLKHDFETKFDCVLAIGVFDYVNRHERDDYFYKLKSTAKKKIIATFPRRFVFQAPIRKTLFLIKDQPVFFYTKKMIVNIGKRHDLKVYFHDSGPIWTVEFIKQ